MKSHLPFHPHKWLKVTRKAKQREIRQMAERLTEIRMKEAVKS
jgi:hypothetical protein